MSSSNKFKSDYTRVKSGNIKPRKVSHTPDMSNPSGRVVNPKMSIGSVPVAVKSAPVASVHVEPKIRTVNATEKTRFPYAIVFLAVICSALFMYMIFNFVQINEHTESVSLLKSDIASLKAEEDKLASMLEQKNDVSNIEKIAKEEYGMVKLEEISRKYIEIDSGDVVITHKPN